MSLGLKSKFNDASISVNSALEIFNLGINIIPRWEYQVNHNYKYWIYLDC